jgi:hypothetical protein
MMSMRPRRSIPSLALVLCAGPAIVFGQLYVEDVNDQLPVDDRWTATGGHEQAFRWTPQNSFDLVQILWHCSPIQSGTIRVRVDTGSTPGAVLREVDFSSTTTGWNGAPFDEPIAVTAGQTYFVSFQSNVPPPQGDYHQFIAQEGPGGQVLTYYWTSDGGRSWNGPFTFAGRRMIKMYEPESSCDPCDMNCDGTVTAFDIEPFLNLLFDPKATPCDTCTGDANGDGRIDPFDIEPFLECLFP